MFNLVLNGLEAMPNGGTLTVRTSSKKMEESQPTRGRKFVIVEVQDTGVGIPPERLSSIFEPFQSSKESGTGLGLAIVKQKIDELGGKISVESKDGTRFTLELPVLGRA
jgi:signal transduction histidine kinase